MSANDITVIGAGVIGLCSALQLQQQGLRVRVIDNSASLINCSRGNAGHFATEQVNPLANWALLRRLPLMLLNPRGPLCIRPQYLPSLAPWFARFISNASRKRIEKNRSALYDLNCRAIPAWQRLLAHTSGQKFMSQSGHLLVFESARQGAAYFRAQQKLSDHGISCRAVDKNELKRLIPGLAASVKFGIFYDNTASTFSPDKLLAHLSQCFLKNGGKLEQDQIDTLRYADSTFFISGDKQYESPKLLLAAGAWTKRLSAQLGYEFPLETERGYHLMLPDLRRVIPFPIASFERSFIMTPMEEGLRLAGTVELAGLDAAPNFARAQVLLKHAQRVLTLPEPETLPSTWMGCRPSLPDSLPVISEACGNKSLFFAFGHQHLGLTQAAITGELIADLICGNKPELDLHPYRGGRF